MKRHNGLVIALALALAGTALLEEAGAQRGRRGAASSLPQVTCTNAQASPQATTAQDALNRTLITRGTQKQDYLQDALEQATAGLQADEGNPYHHFQRAQALIGLVEFHGQNAGPEYRALFPESATINADEAVREGISSLNRAVELCAELGTEGATLRQQAAQQAFNLATQRYSAADTATAIALWQTVARIDTTNADAVFNAALATVQRGQAAAAAPLFRRLLQMTSPTDTARTEQRGFAVSQMLNAGAALFNENRYAEAADLFAYLQGLDRHNRDALYNQALALYRLQRWADLVPVASRVVEMDPLNYNAQIILFNAYKGLSDQAKTRNDAAAERTNRDLALRTLQRADSLPVQVEGISFTPAEGAIIVRGEVVGSTAAAGTPIRLEFTLTNPGGPAGTGVATVNAPAKDARAPFEVRVPITAPVTSYRYRVLN